MSIKKFSTFLFTYFIFNSIFSQNVCVDMEAYKNNVNHNANVLHTFAEKKRLWDNKQIIRVKFFGGNDYVKQKIIKYATEWERYANVSFQFVNAGYAEIRISFIKGSSWSYIGKTSTSISQNSPSMNFGWFTNYTSDREFSKVILHEFGHALGLLHEHKHPQTNFKWNLPKVYAYYQTKLGWTKDEVRENVIDRYGNNSNYTNSIYDSKSIMHYPIPKELTLNGYYVPWNTKLSDGDKKNIAEIYPGKSIFIDSDGDGVYDDEDHCPYQYGSRDNNGCPKRIIKKVRKDSDGDGVYDDEDHCPYQYGDKDNNGCPKIIINKRGEYSEELYLFKGENEKYGFIDKTGRIIIQNKYDYASSFSENLAGVMKNGELGFIDKIGTMIIQNKYKSASSFSENRAKVKKNGKWGIIDKTGKIIIPFIYNNIFLSKGIGIDAVEKNEKWGAIDKAGKTIIPIIYDNIGVFSESIIEVKKNDKWGVINKKGEIIIPVIYDEFGTGFFFTKELFNVKKNGKWGIIDKTGKMLVPVIYNEINLFTYSKGIIEVKKNDKWGALDKMGEIIIPFIYDDLSFYSEGIVRAEKNGKYGFIDKTGKQISLFVYDIGTRGFSESLAKVNKNGKYGFIDKTGKMIIQNKYDYAKSFSGGYSIVKINKKYGIINKKGRIVIPTIYDEIINFYNKQNHLKMFKVKKDGSYFYTFVYLDKTGKEIIPHN